MVAVTVAVALVDAFKVAVSATRSLPFIVEDNDAWSSAFCVLPDSLISADVLAVAAIFSAFMSSMLRVEAVCEVALSFLQVILSISTSLDVDVFSAALLQLRFLSSISPLFDVVSNMEPAPASIFPVSISPDVVAVAISFVHAISFVIISPLVDVSNVSVEALFILFRTLTFPDLLAVIDFTSGAYRAMRRVLFPVL